MRPTDRPHSVYTANLRGLTNGPHLRAVPHPFLPRTRLFNDQFSFHPDRSPFVGRVFVVVPHVRSMEEDVSQKSNFSSESVRMSSVAEASDLVRQLAAPAQIGDTIKRQISHAARRIPFWSYSRTRDAWYGSPRMRIHADEILKLRELARDTAAARDARNEFRLLQDRLARLETALGLSDEEFHRPTLVVLRGQTRGVDSAVDSD